MIRVGAVLFGLMCLAGPAQAAAQAYRDPPRRWFWDVERGTVTAAVRNNPGAELRFWCPTRAGSPDDQPALRLSLPQVGPSRGAAESLDAVFEIDGYPYEWRVNRSPGSRGEVTYGSRAFNLPTQARHNDLASKLRRGHRLVVYIPADRVMQLFTLDGSTEALDGCDDG